ncbi:hypothetical protein G6F59_017474 [Rhizopus arrhizus]|nr:hypothetical protein G6F59_017474 [Rhizopus arrhizus]
MGLLGAHSPGSGGSRLGLECGHLFHAALSAKDALLHPSRTVLTLNRRAQACAVAVLGLALWMPAAAHAQAAAPAAAPTYLKATEPLGGAFELEGYPASTLRQIKYRGKAYRPLNAYEVI